MIGLDKKIGDKKLFLSLLNNDISNVYVGFVNPFSYQYIANDQTKIQQINFYFADGILLKILHNLFYKNKVDRVSFDYSSIADNVFNFIESVRGRLGIIGALPEEVDLAVENIITRYPNLYIDFVRHGYFESHESMKTVAQEIKSSGIEYLLVGMGTPKQEDFMCFIKESQIPLKLCISCGGFITQTSLKPDFYLDFVKKFNLMWLQRIIMFRHVRIRFIKYYPRFIFFYLLAKIKEKFM